MTASHNPQPRRTVRKSADRNESLRVRTQLIPFYRHPLIHAVLIFCVLGALAFGALDFYVRRMRAEALGIPELPVTPEFPPLKGANIDAGAITEATLLYRTAILTPPKNYYAALKALHDRFPGSPEGRVTAEEFARLDEPFRVIREAEALKAQQEQEERERLETEAQELLETILASKDGAPKKLARLEGLVAKYPDTAAAATAGEHITGLKEEIEKARAQKPQPKPADTARKPEPTPHKPVPEPKKPAPDKPAPEFVYDASEFAALEVFIQRYRQMLSQWQLDEAVKLAESLAGSTRFPKLAHFARNCLEDLKVLSAFHATLSGHFNSLRGKEVQVTLARGSQIKGAVSKVEGNRLTLVVGGRYPQHLDLPVGLNAEEMLQIYAGARGESAPPLELVRPLFFYALDNEFAARNFFSQLGRKNPRAAFHMALMKYTYKE